MVIIHIILIFNCIPPWLFVQFTETISEYLVWLDWLEQFTNDDTDSNNNASAIDYCDFTANKLYNEFLYTSYSAYNTLSDLLDSLQAFVGVPVEDCSMCSLYCQFPADQRQLSQYTYDLQTDLSYTKGANESLDPTIFLTFVNGQLMPNINDMVVNIYRRLRIVNSLSNYYLQMKFPSQYCDWHLLATDGIYVNTDQRNYNLNASTHQNNYMVAPGGRVDLLVRCTVVCSVC